MAFDPFALAQPGICELHPYQPGKPVGELERELGISNIIKLASNENPLGPSPRALEAIQNNMQDCARYPDGNGFALKQALAKHHGLDQECITLGNGSNDVLELLARVFTGPGKQILFSEHAFAVYPIAAKSVGADAVIVSANNWGYDLDALLDAISADSRLIFIANPNNPTGTWVRAEPLRTFIEEVPQHALVVVDQAYGEYMDDPEYPDCVDWLDRFPNLIVTHTFSKAFGLAGLRIGYAVSAPGIAEILDRIRQPFNVNLMANVAALTALEDRQHLAHSVEMNAAERDRVQTALAGFGLHCVPSAGNFVLVDMGQPAMPVYDALLRKSVIVRPVANYGLDRHLRISIGTPPENDRLLQALGEVLDAASGAHSEAGNGD